MPWKRVSGLDFEGGPLERDIGQVGIARGEARGAVHRQELGHEWGAEQSCKSSDALMGALWSRRGSAVDDLNKYSAALESDDADGGEEKCFDIASIERDLFGGVDRAGFCGGDDRA